MNKIRLMVTSLAVIGLGMLLGAGAYESVVMAPNYAAQVPISLEHARSFMAVSNPGLYFRVLAPVTQVLLLLAAVLNWRVPAARWWMLGALLALAASDVITFKFHYPRNELMFLKPLDQTSLAQLQEAARTWGPGNSVRVGLLAVAILSALRGLVRSAKGTAGETPTERVD